ncbi:diguanylate cyclase (GGDEF) domain-containing protein [Parelusimicrobium proximum]|uniref:GGDEF domain-containing response regulator n=1 Tax=Parelusimicrobium proximum TaxID=3228953 RepID=UPI003D173185
MNNTKILVADDNPAILAMVSEILTDAGAHVITAVDGNDAIEKIYRENPALCILDYDMPYKTGFDVVKEVRSRSAYVNMPIVIFTATNDKETKMQGLGLDIDDYLNKPADADEIVARIKLLIRRSKQKLDSNPLTRLPGNPSIQAAVEARIQSGATFAVLYLDLNNFKAYNDKYGFEAGDKVLKKVADIISSSAGLDDNAFIGHVGGDDFVVVSSYEKAEEIAQKVIDELEAVKKSFYCEDDRNNGYMISHNRRGETQNFPLLSIGIGVVHNTRRPLTSFAMVSSIATELKALAKRHDGSYYVFDRREN